MSEGQKGTNVCITNNLARIVGLIAQKHPECSVEVAWYEGADERDWIVTATDGVTDHIYIADDEAGHWAPANDNDLRNAHALV